MKKYIFALITLVVLAIVSMIYYKSTRPTYRHIRPHSKLLKETWVWLYDSAVYKREGTYLRIYRNYDYEYHDSIMHSEHIKDYTDLDYAVTYRGDTIYMEFTDLTNYPHRED